MKYCTKGSHDVPLDSFNKRSKSKDGLNAWCKDCLATYEKNRYNNGDKERKVKNHIASIERGRAYIWGVLLRSKCLDCGESDPRVLDFDHLIPSLKRTNVVELFQNSVTTIQTEIDKCVIRCSNCHRIKTAEQFGYWRSIKYDSM